MLRITPFQKIVILLLITGNIPQWINFYRYHSDTVTWETGKRVSSLRWSAEEDLSEKAQTRPDLKDEEEEWEEEEEEEESRVQHWSRKRIRHRPKNQKWNIKVRQGSMAIQHQQWVCITSRNKEVTFKEYNEDGWKWFLRDTFIRMPARQCPIPQKIITIHDNQKAQQEQRYFGFIVKHSSDPIPEDYEVIEDRVAFFNHQDPIKYPCRQYNFYHFIAQEFFPLYSMMKKANRLGLPNDVFYTKHLGFCPGKFVPFDLKATKPFLTMLGVENTNRSIFDDLTEPNKVCYKDAYFTDTLLLDNALDATDFIKRKLSVKEVCPFENRLIIIQRGSYRKILNADKLREVAAQSGYNASVVIMEKLTLPEQAQLIQCTDVIVGVKGAAMTWTVALKNHSGVIEIAWPKKEWPFYFTATKGRQKHSPLFGIRPLNLTQIAVDNCKIEPEYVRKYYESMFLKKSNFTDNDIQEIIKHKKNYGFLKQYVMSLGKLCDIFVPEGEFKRALKEVRSSKNKLLY